VKSLVSDTNWLLFGYEGLTSNKLKVVGTGDGGFAEMVDELHPASPMHVFLMTCSLAPLIRMLGLLCGK